MIADRTATAPATCTVKALRAEARRLKVRNRSIMTNDRLREFVAAAQANEARLAAEQAAAATTRPFHAIKPGDVIRGREVFDTRPVLGGVWVAIDAYDRPIVRVRSPYALVEIA